MFNKAQTKKILTIFLLGICSVFLVGSILWLGTTEGERIWYNPDYPYANQSFRVSEFINVSGDNFTLGGENYRFLGADSYYLSDYATNLTYDDDGNQITNSRQYVEEILNEAQYLNFNVIRTWAGSQGSDDSHWVINESGGHYNLFEVGTPGNYSEEMFQALDWVIYEASKRDIRLQLVFVNNWNDYGGMRWYAQKSPTTDKTYENVSSDSDDNWWTFHDQFYTDENCRTYYRNYINHTLNRNNTYSGILYKDDPAIFAWLLANEARAKSDGTGRTKIKDWTTNMTAYVKSIDSNHLVGLGIEGWGYVETWGEGTDMIADHNNTGVDFATFALHPDQWAYFAERSEHTGNTGDWVDEGTGSNDFVDWWTNDTNVSFNNRYEGSYVPAYTPALARGNYDNWVTQNVKWANELGMPVLLQEAGYLTSHDKTIKDRFYEQMIHSFYKEGGDGLLFWTLNHDNYYYSTNINGSMDDGYGFYLSDDPFLKNKSQSIIDAINFTKHDNNGGSWITELNSYKYDFVLNVETAGIHNDSVSSDGCVLNLWLEKNATDMSGNGNDGTIYGATNTTGLVGWGMEFDGVNDEIVILNSESINTTLTGSNLTISGWVKIIDNRDWKRIIVFPYSGARIETSGGKIDFYRIYNRSGDSVIVYPDCGSINKWTHFSLTYNGSNVKFYCNGIKTHDNTGITGDLQVGTGNLLIGRADSSGMNGTQDEVLIFNRSLSATEIQTIYNNSLKSQPGVATIKNASLYLNTYNGTWSGYILDQNTTALIEDTDYTFTKQFETTDQEAYWYIQSCDDYDLCLNSSVTHIQILSATPIITLSKPANETYFPSGNTVFNYSVTDTLEISNCQLYINDILNKTDYTITRDTDQSFTTTIPNNLENYTWKVKCTDVGDNVGTSNVRTFYVDPTNPDIEFVSPTPDDNSNQSTNSVYVNVSSSDDSPHSVTLDWNRSLKGWWRFNEDTLANDSSSWGNDGTVTGATWTSDGKLGGAYEFDGVNDEINLNDNIIPTNNDFTINLWVSLGSKGSAFTAISQYLAGDPGRFRLSAWHPTGNNIDLQIGSFKINGGSDLRGQGWYMITVIRNINNYTLYLNKELISSGVSSLNVYQGNTKLGTEPGDERFNGSIDDVKIHSRALSPEEIKADYNANLYKYSHNFTDLAEGTYNYTAYAQDFAGNVNETSRSVLLDLTNPNATLNTPLNNTYSDSSSNNFTSNLTDNYGLANATIYIYNSVGSLVNETTIQLSNAVQYTWGLVVDLADGVYTWFVKVFDVAGNSDTSGNYTLTVDSTAPVVTKLAPASSIVTTSIIQTYIYNISDTNNITSCSLLMDGVIVQTDTSINKSENNSITYKGTIGTHIWSVQCYDEYSNIGTSGNFSIQFYVGHNGGVNGGTTCTPVWDCSNWGFCVNGLQTRECESINSCTRNKPEEDRTCSVFGSISDGLGSVTIDPIVTRLNCGSKPEVGEWSGCNSLRRTSRINYECSKETEFEWLSYTDTKDCREVNGLWNNVGGFFTKSVPNFFKKVWDVIIFWN